MDVYYIRNMKSKKCNKITLNNLHQAGPNKPTTISHTIARKINGLETSNPGIAHSEPTTGMTEMYALCFILCVERGLAVGRPLSEDLCYASNHELHGAQFLSMKIAQPPKIFPNIVELKIQLLFPQESTTGLSHEPDGSSQQHHNLLQINSNTLSPSKPRPFKWSLANRTSL